MAIECASGVELCEACVLRLAPAVSAWTLTDGDGTDGTDGTDGRTGGRTEGTGDVVECARSDTAVD